MNHLGLSGIGIILSTKQEEAHTLMAVPSWKMTLVFPGQLENQGMGTEIETEKPLKIELYHKWGCLHWLPKATRPSALVLLYKFVTRGVTLVVLCWLQLVVTVMVYRHFVVIFMVGRTPYQEVVQLPAIARISTMDIQQYLTNQGRKPLPSPMPHPVAGRNKFLLNYLSSWHYRIACIFAAKAKVTRTGVFVEDLNSVKDMRDVLVDDMRVWKLPCVVCCGRQWSSYYWVKSTRFWACLSTLA